MLFTVVGHSLGKLVSMSQKEVHIESTCSVEHFDCGLQIGSLARIGSPDFPSVQINRKVGGAGDLSHPMVLLVRTKALIAFSLLLFRLVVTLLETSRAPYTHSLSTPSLLILRDFIMATT